MNGYLCSYLESYQKLCPRKWLTKRILASVNKYSSPSSIRKIHILMTAQIHIYDIIGSRNMHKWTHTPTCFKYGNKRKCRACYPCKLISKTYFDPETGVVELERDDEWLVGYNSWLSLMMRANHDGQFLFTKNHAWSVIHYIMKYISKPEDSLHSK